MHCPLKSCLDAQNRAATPITARTTPIAHLAPTGTSRTSRRHRLTRIPESLANDVLSTGVGELRKMLEALSSVNFRPVAGIYDDDLVLHHADAGYRPRRALGLLSLGQRAYGAFEDHLAVIGLDGDAARVDFCAAPQRLFY